MPNQAEHRFVLNAKPVINTRVEWSFGPLEDPGACESVRVLADIVFAHVDCIQGVNLPVGSTFGVASVYVVWMAARRMAGVEEHLTSNSDGMLLKPLP